MMTIPCKISTRSRGFSAVEVIAVAAIIAILALILIPKLSERVEHTREVAVEDEMTNMVKFITLSYAESGKYVRLQDYDNGTTLRPTGDPDHDPAREVPLYTYDPATGVPVLLTAVQRDAFARRWNGPYVQFLGSKKSITIGELKANTFWANMLSTNSGPIVVAADTSDDEDRYPLDPWGNPYFFFPPETDYATCLIFSMGPDGMPGSVTTPVAEDYFPAERTTGGELGRDDSDDIRWEF